MHKHDIKSQYEINTIPKDHVRQKVLLFDIYIRVKFIAGNENCISQFQALESPPLATLG